MNLNLANAAPAEVKKIKELYYSAFPKDERAPFSMMARKARQGKGRMLAAKDGETFVGFAYIVENAACAYLFYLAIVPETRGAGYGSAILSKLRGMYKGKRLFLARESLDPASDNYDQRVRRHEFYLRNGFADLECKIREYKVTFDVMSIGGDITPDDYAGVMTPWCGKFLVKYAPMKLIPPTERRNTP